MLATLSLCVLLAPCMVSAIPWAGPEATFIAPEIDAWSPAPTGNPLKPGFMELFKRQNPGANTCGYINATSTRSLTCNNGAQVCATNSIFGVHGCCNPASLDDCTIPTTCVPSTALSASCTAASCLNNAYVTKCSNSAAPYCYQWRYVFPSTTMTEHGCASSAFTILVQRTFAGQTVDEDFSSSSLLEVPISTRVVTVTASNNPSSNANASPEPSALSANGNNNNNNSSNSNNNNGGGTPVGAIVGGVVGGVGGLALIVGAIVFLLLRNKKKKKAAATGVTPGQPAAAGAFGGDYKQQPMNQQYPQQPYMQQQPGNAQAGYYATDQQHKDNFLQVNGPQPGPYSPPGSPAPQYTQMAAGGAASTTPAPQAEAQHLDSTPVQGPPRNQEGNVIHEAPA